MKIGILGAGAFGTALGNILLNNEYNVNYYDPKLDNKLSDVVNHADYLLLAVPSLFVVNIIPELPNDIPLIIATKGLLTDDIFNKFNNYMIISGPGFADDINNHKKTYFTVTDERLEELFKADYLVFDYTTDKKGVLMCGALKNVYAILAGYLGLTRDTIKWQDFINDVSSEMRVILEKSGADPHTFDLVCGRGDLELTCGLPSRNYEFGIIKSEKPSYKPEKTVEGLSTIEKIRRGDLFIPDEAVLLQKIIKLSAEWK